MKDSDRFKLYFGPYKTPRFKYGKKVWCHYRGWVKIVGLSDGKIQWPIGRPMTPKPGRDSLIIYHGLKRAIEQESNQAVAHWWGVAKKTVSRWRGAISVGRNTPGTVRTFDVTLKAESRRTKIADSKLGKPRPKCGGSDSINRFRSFRLRTRGEAVKKSMIGEQCLVGRWLCSM